ncbi:hypothetical protein P152DRAFT_111513 [Eremomyces bilateralis CBS 781.70]|uniref:Homeobox domain-containing protein n=1 Tax=Eremomyces bilateralis CBS 781.70 TaxID=1392243 RepID=A0A6G1GDN3_9PEZI|nr:uncharacterized protein P152DRAFT_111513 [Eremomyces bilateralis CBS 781.70]KAF1816132.1 hypothetical protein P152DRAFT_111513 [Eremomyces bilateralis CBS 781.70]
MSDFRYSNPNMPDWSMPIESDGMDVDEILQSWDPARTSTASNYDYGETLGEFRYEAGDSNEAGQEFGKAWHIDSGGQGYNFEVQDIRPSFSVDTLSTPVVNPTASTDSLNLNSPQQFYSHTMPKNKAIDKHVVTLLTAVAAFLRNKELLVTEGHFNSLSKLTGAHPDGIKEWFGLNSISPPSYDSGYQSSSNTSSDEASPSVSTSPPVNKAKCLPSRCCLPSSDRSSLRRDPGKIYQCTRKCGKRYGRKSEWKRHEEDAYPLKQWQCALCIAHGRSMRLTSRRDKYMQHFRNMHPGIDPRQYEDQSIVTMDDIFPTWCGFCLSNAAYTSREERLDHLEMHFKTGKCMIDWVDENSAGTGSSGYDDDNGDNDGDSSDGPDGSGTSGGPHLPKDPGGQNKRNGGDPSNPNGAWGYFSGFGDQYQGNNVYQGATSSRSASDISHIDAQTSSMDEVTYLTRRFESLLRVKRMNNLPSTTTSRSPSSFPESRATPPSYSSLRNIPTIPTPPIQNPTSYHDLRAMRLHMRHGLDAPRKAPTPSQSHKPPLDPNRCRAWTADVSRPSATISDDDDLQPHNIPAPRPSGYVCQFCDRRFDLAEVYERHLKHVHGACQHCGERFPDVFQRLRHTRRCALASMSPAAGHSGHSHEGFKTLLKGYITPSRPGIPRPISSDSYLQLRCKQGGTPTSTVTTGFVATGDQPRSHRLTKPQFDVLEAQFRLDRRPTTVTKEALAEQLHTTLEKVNTWFQTRRIRQKHNLQMQLTLDPSINPTIAGIPMDYLETDALCGNTVTDPILPSSGIESLGLPEQVVRTWLRTPLDDLPRPLLWIRGMGKSQLMRTSRCFNPDAKVNQDAGVLCDPSRRDDSMRHNPFPLQVPAIQEQSLQKQAMNQLEYIESSRRANNRGRKGPLTLASHRSAAQARELRIYQTPAVSVTDGRAFFASSAADIFAGFALANLFALVNKSIEEINKMNRAISALRSFDLDGSEKQLRLLAKGVQDLGPAPPQDGTLYWALRMDHPTFHLAKSSEAGKSDLVSDYAWTINDELSYLAAWIPVSPLRLSGMRSGYVKLDVRTRNDLWSCLAACIHAIVEGLAGVPRSYVKADPVGSTLVSLGPSSLALCVSLRKRDGELGEKRCLSPL